MQETLGLGPLTGAQFVTCGNAWVRAQALTVSSVTNLFALINLFRALAKLTRQQQQIGIPMALLTH
jgi:hypothetical protein